MPEDGGSRLKRPLARYVVAGSVVALAALGIGLRLHFASASKQKLADAYPRLEQLLAIYSVFSWRSSDQRPPVVTEKGETSGSELALECPKVQWGKGGSDRTDSLFTCFKEPRTIYVPEAGEQVETIQLPSAEENSYEFTWESVFGYELTVSLRGYEALEQTNPIARERIACLEELKSFNNSGDVCNFQMYRVTLSGLTVSKSVSFITADGKLSWNPDGSVQRRNERIIYFDADTPISIGALNAVIQKALRALGIAEQDVAKVGPQMEVLWMGKDEAFLRALAAEIEKVPDMTKLSGYLQGK